MTPSIEVTHEGEAGREHELVIEFLIDTWPLAGRMSGHPDRRYPPEPGELHIQSVYLKRGDRQRLLDDSCHSDLETIYQDELWEMAVEQSNEERTCAAEARWESQQDR